MPFPLCNPNLFFSLGVDFYRPLCLYQKRRLLFLLIGISRLFSVIFILSRPRSFVSHPVSGLLPGSRPAITNSFSTRKGRFFPTVNHPFLSQLLVFTPPCCVLSAFSPAFLVIRLFHTLVCCPCLLLPQTKRVASSLALDLEQPGFPNFFLWGSVFFFSGSSALPFYLFLPHTSDKRCVAPFFRSTFLGILSRFVPTACLPDHRFWFSRSLLLPSLSFQLSHSHR